jgi:23S rRNA (uracil1939-C5)-methyltransferase
MTKQFRKGHSLELFIDDLSFGARGVARLDDFVWFVEHGIPGQKVRARVRRVKQSYGEAFIEEVLEPSPHQVDPPCPYFGICGGCQLQHLSYDVQVQAKTRQVKEILERIGGLEKLEVRPTLAAERIYGYRNKMEFTFSVHRWLTEEETPNKPREFALGLHVPKRFDKVLDIDACPLQSELANKVLRTAKDLILQTGLKPYNIKSHAGFYRFLVIREGKNTGDIMLNFITSGQDHQKGKEAIDWIVHKLFWRHPEVTTVLHSTTDKKAQVALGESERLILGIGKITERIGDRIFEISPGAFFQTNTHQAQRLFETIAELANFQGDEIVYDLYCGTGAIGICIADRVKKVLGIEVIPSAIKDAKRNIELNGLSNVEFVLADMKDALGESSTIIQTYGSPDVVMLDPPRGGTHPKTAKGLLNLAPPKILYVSCNPAILARDLQVLCENTYTQKIIQPVDMFPHTGHIEVVALLLRNY